MPASPHHPQHQHGTVYLVGAGPGAPDLLTLRAAQLLESADIVFFDALVHADTIALAARAEKIAVGKRCGAHSAAQSFINKRLVDAAKKHRIVVRLKGGDPMLFGRAQEEIDALGAAGIAVAVVPGITAACATAAQLKTSLTARGVARSVAFVTPRVGAGQRANDWLSPLLAADTGMVYMGANEATGIAAALIEAGKRADTSVVLVESASLAHSQQHRTTLKTLATSGFSAIPSSTAGPVMMGIGTVFHKVQATKQPAQPVIARAA